MEGELGRLVEECRGLAARGSGNLPHMVRLAAVGTPEAIQELLLARGQAERLLDVLATNYSMEVALPRNVDPLRDFELVVWPDPLNDPRLYGLLLLAGFTFSFYRRDGKSEYEPLEFVFLKEGNSYRPLFAYARVHYDLCEYNIQGVERIRVIYTFHGHTPYIDGVGYVRLRCPKVKRSSVHTGRKYWDRMWLGAATTFLKITGVQRLRLRKLLDLGLVKVMKCPTNFAKNPFEGPMFRPPL